MTQFKCSGRVIDITTGAGAPGLRLEAWDTEGVCSDLVACAFTGLKGVFEFVLEEDYVRELFGDRTPTLYFRIFDDEGTLLRNTQEESVHWTVQPIETTLRIEVDPSHLPASEDPAPFVVQGYLLMDPGNYRVKAFDKMLEDEDDVLLEEMDIHSASAEENHYRIEYEINPIAGAVAGYPLPGKQAADLIVRVIRLDWNATTEVWDEGPQLCESTVHCHAPPTATIDVTGEGYSGPTEWEDLLRRLGPALGAAALGDVLDELGDAVDLEDTDAIARLACSTGLTVEDVTRMVAVAHVPDGGSGTYGLFRALGSNDMADLLRLRPSTIIRILQEAADNRIIPPIGDTGPIHTGLCAAIGDAALAGTLPNNTTSTLSDLLGILLTDSADRNLFIRAYVAHEGPISEFWEAVEELDGEVFDFDDPTAKARLQRLLQLGALTRYHLPLVSHLDGLFLGAPPTHTLLRDLASYDEAGWIAILELGDPDIGFPSTIPPLEGTDEERKANYAAVLTRTMETAFPTAAIAARVTNADLQTFFSPTGQNTNFEFGKTRLAVHLASTENPLTGIDPENHAAVVEKLQAMERLFKIVPRHVEMKFLLDDEAEPEVELRRPIHSAQAIQRLGKGPFVAKYASGLGGTAAAEAVYDKARQVTGMALALYTKYSLRTNSASAGVLPKFDLTYDPENDDESFADWTTLFGSSDLCACEHCRSVYGPAAYLLDLFQFLGRQKIESTTAKDILFTKRPDLQHIELSCENSDTVVPYVDLVNEILEARVATELELEFSYDPIKTTGTPKELRAMPEVLLSGVYSAAYEGLAATVFPWALPFDLFVEEQRVYLSHLGISRHALMETFQAAPSAIEIASAHLGLTHRDGIEITSGDGASFPGWPAAQEDDLLETIHQVPVFLRVSGLTYDELLELLDSTYVNGEDGNGVGSTLVKISITPEGCDVQGSTLENLIYEESSEPKLDRLERIYQFVRLRHKLGCTLGDLDRMVAALGSTVDDALVIDDTFLLKLSGLFKLQAALKLTLGDALALCGNIETRARQFPTSVSYYEQLFLSKSVMTPPDDAFALSEVAPNPPEEAEEPLANHTAGLLAALRISSTDLALLIEALLDEDPVLSLGNITALYRAAVLSRAVNLTVRDMLTLRLLLGATAFDSMTPDDTLAFVDVVRIVRASGFLPAELDYLVRHVSQGPDSGAPDETGIHAVLADIDTTLASTLVAVDPVPASYHDLVEARLQTLLGTELAGDAMGILELDPEPTVGEVYTFIDTHLAQYFDNSADIDRAKLHLTGFDPNDEPPPNPAATVDPAAPFDGDGDDFEARYLVALSSLLESRREAVEKVLGALLAPADAETAMKLLDGTSTDTWATLSAFFDANLAEFFADVSGMKTKLIGASASPVAPTPPYDIARLRYMAVLPDLLTYQNRLNGTNVVEQKLSAALGVTAAALRAMLAAIPAQVGGEAKALADFVPRDPTEDSGVREARQQLTFLRLHKCAMLSRKLNLIDELPFLIVPPPPNTNPPNDPGWLDWTELPYLPYDEQNPPPFGDLFKSWKRVVDLCAFRKYFSAKPKGALAAVLAADASSPQGDVLAVLADRTGWSQALIDELIGEDEQQQQTGLWWSAFPPQTHIDERDMHRLGKALDALKRLGVSATVPVGWTNFDADIEAATAITHEMRRAVKSKYDEAAWLEVARAMRDDLREKQRAALVAYLMGRYGYETSNKLFGDLLVDVEMCACQDTSRIKHAIGSVQLFVHRCLMNLEKTEEEVVISLGEDAAREWKWMKSYRIWEANRKVFLYPENWIEPELRDDKTPFFKELESDLLQGDITEERAEDVYRRYLDKLHEVAHLDVVGIFHQLESDPAVDVVHVFARTRATPHVYYYRRWVSSTHWTPWEKVIADIQGDHLIPVVHQRRLYVFWPIIIEVGNDPPTNGDPTRKHMEIRLAWVERKNGKWSPKKVGQDDPLIHFRTWQHKYITFATLSSDTSLRITCIEFLGGMYIKIGHFILDGCDGQLRVEPLWNGGINPSPSSQIIPLRFAQGAGLMHMDMQEATSYNGLALPLSLQNMADMSEVLGETPGGPGQTPGPFRLLASRDLLPDVASQFLGLEVVPWTLRCVFFKDSSRTFFMHWVGDAAVHWTNPVKSQPLKILPIGKDYSHGFEPPLTDWLDTDNDASVIPHAKVTESGYRFETFYHPYACEFIKQLNARGLDGLFARSLQLSHSAFSFSDEYHPVSELVRPEHPREDVDFSLGGAYSQYNWELFFHAPLLIATRLMSDQRYAEAQKWFHRIFDPTDGSTDPAPQRFWKVRPFYEHQNLNSIHEDMVALATEANNSHAQELQALIDPAANKAAAARLAAEIGDWRDHPFNPHIIARRRIIAYQKTTVMKYLDNLIAWGDQLFSHDTIESINEATLVYILAADILGERPRTLTDRNPLPVMTYDDLKDDLDEFSNALIKLESMVELPDNTPPLGNDEPPPTFSLYFCIPQNDKLLGYWDTVADRLFKIRHCMNIEGVVRALPLFEPPIDPALLVRAAAAGIPPDELLNELSAPLPHYRFSVMHAKAMEFAGSVTSLGAQLLAALEKRDVEALSLLRSTHEIRLLEASRAVREQQIAEAAETLAGLRRSRDVVAERHTFYKNIKPRNPKETEYFDQMDTAAGLKVHADRLHGFATVMHVLPTIIATVTGGSEWGPKQLAGAAESGASLLNVIAQGHRDDAAVAATTGSFDRRWEDWKLQERLAAKELKQIEKQIAAAEIRKAITEKELKNHDLQIQNSREVDEFLRNKFTSQELYDWTKQQVASVYFQSYKLAVDMSKRAQRTFQFERCEPDASFITTGYWDSLKQGLLAGEKLQYDLRRMDAAYLEKNKREYEITKHVSLATLNPAALLALRATGACEVEIPESEFDLDFPGHYMRRIKSVSMTIPCVAGPYSSVNCTLRLLHNQIRKSVTPQSSYDDGPYIDDYGMLQAIATSTAQNDAGVFELNFRDERYLPFEGAGAISNWRIELPKENNLIDMDTVDDVVLHIRYTARDGGAPLKTKALTALGDAPGFRLFSVKTEFPVEWALFLNPPAEQEDHVLSVQIDPMRFEAHRGKESLDLSNVTLYAQWREPEAYQGIPAQSSPYNQAQLEIGVTPPGESPTAVTLVLNDPDSLYPLAHGSATTSGTTGLWTITVTSDALHTLGGHWPEENEPPDPAPSPLPLGRTFMEKVAEFCRLKPDALQDMWLLCSYERLPAE